MLRASVSVLALVACGSLAVAADLEGPSYLGSLKDDVAAPVAQNWSGLYIGLHAGYGWGEWDGNMLYTDATPGDGFDANGKTIDTEGAIAGGQIGFNVQDGSFVWGIEGDAAWSGIEGGERLLPYPVNFPANGSPAWDFDSEIKWLATLRARLGLARGPALFYVTGGLALAEVDSHLTVVGEGYSAFGNKSETKTGWTIGGGMEYMLDQNWSVKAEYQYINLGEVGGILPGQQTTSCNPPCAHTTDGFEGDLDLHTVRLGVNYKFGN